MEESWPSLGFPLSVFARKVHGLALEHVEAMFAPAFFVGMSVKVAGERVPMVTNPEGLAAEVTGDMIMVVHPLRRRPESAHAFISVGRIGGNDVVIDDSTISKFHAYLREVDGAYLLQDARSRNGTKVDGVAVAPRGSGPPTMLMDRQVVAVGGVSLSFVTCSSLVAMAARLSTF